VQADISIVLKLPDRPENALMFLLGCDLLADDGAVLQETRRTLLTPQRSLLSKSIRNVVLLPLYVSGLLSETEVVHSSNIAQHRETAGAALGAIRVSLRRQMLDYPLPLVQEAFVRVDVNQSALQIDSGYEMWTWPSTELPQWI
jgi:hypothetical protein